MNDKRFTPGPWWIVPMFGKSEGFAIGTNIQRDGMNTIAEVKKTKWTQDEGENAYLIAAAPELYEALESTSRELNMVISELNEMKRARISSSDLQPPDYHDQQTVHENMVLLAKARGE